MTPISETEAAILRVLAGSGKRTWTPDQAAYEVKMSRQQVVPVVNRMEQAELVIARRLSGKVSYAITQPGLNALNACRGPS
jgi:DNA-binding MarR family transcriptional regulator